MQQQQVTLHASWSCTCSVLFCFVFRLSFVFCRFSFLLLLSLDLARASLQTVAVRERQRPTLHGGSSRFELLQTQRASRNTQLSEPPQRCCDVVRNSFFLPTLSTRRQCGGIPPDYCQYGRYADSQGRCCLTTTSSVRLLSFLLMFPDAAMLRCSPMLFPTFPHCQVTRACLGAFP